MASFNPAIPVGTILQNPFREDFENENNGKWLQEVPKEGSKVIFQCFKDDELGKYFLFAEVKGVNYFLDSINAPSWYMSAKKVREIQVGYLSVKITTDVLNKESRPWARVCLEPLTYALELANAARVSYPLAKEAPLSDEAKTHLKKNLALSIESGFFHSVKFYLGQGADPNFTYIPCSKKYFQVFLSRREFIKHFIYEQAHLVRTYEWRSEYACKTFQASPLKRAEERCREAIKYLENNGATLRSYEEMQLARSDYNI